MTTAREIVAAHYAASAAGDIQGAFSNFADDIVWTESAGGRYAGTYTSMAEVYEKVFGRIQQDWEDFAAHLDYLIADNDNNKVAAVVNYHGKSTATGKSQNVRVVHLWTIKDGMVVAFEQVADTAEQNKALS
jgi:ketosteroid isomerase-like protein